EENRGVLLLRTCRGQQGGVPNENRGRRVALIGGRILRAFGARDLGRRSRRRRRPGTASQPSEGQRSSSRERPDQMSKQTARRHPERLPGRKGGRIVGAFA